MGITNRNRATAGNSGREAFSIPRQRMIPRAERPKDSRSWAESACLPGRTQTMAILTMCRFMSSWELTIPGQIRQLLQHASDVNGSNEQPDRKNATAFQVTTYRRADYPLAAESSAKSPLGTRPVWGEMGPDFTWRAPKLPVHPARGPPQSNRVPVLLTGRPDRPTGPSQLPDYPSQPRRRTTGQ
jgi:hypothetical protein